MTEPVKPLARKESWDLAAAGYAAELGLVVRPIAVEAAKLVSLRPDARVIDVACGPGTLAVELAPSVREVCALDFSEQMVSALQSRLAALHIGNVRVELGDGQALPYESDSFDAGFSLFGLMFFPDRARGYRELARVLKSGAPAVISSWAPLSESSLMDLMFGALRASDPEWPPPSYDPESLENPDVLAREMRDGGFGDVRVERCLRWVEVASAPELFERVARSFLPLLLLRKRVGEEEWQRRARICEDFMAARLAGGPIRLSTTAFLGFGRKP